MFVVQEQCCRRACISLEWRAQLEREGHAHESPAVVCKGGEMLL